MDCNGDTEMVGGIDSVRRDTAERTAEMSGSVLGSTSSKSSKN
jgi:hypothetical protein